MSLDILLFVALIPFGAEIRVFASDFRGLESAVLEAELSAFMESSGVELNVPSDLTDALSEFAAQFSELSETCDVASGDSLMGGDCPGSVSGDVTMGRGDVIR